MPVSNQLGWLEHVWKGLSILVPVLVMVVQVQRNYKNTLESQQEHLRRQMCLEIYREFADMWQKAADRLTDLGATTEALNSYMHLRMNPVFHGSPPLVADTAELLEAKKASSATFIQLVFCLEKYEVALPGFSSMRGIMIDQHQQMNDALSHLFNDFLIYVPRKDLIRSNANLVWEIPSPDTIKVIDAKYESWNELHFDLLAFMMDLRIEVQNALIAPFFGRKVPERQPTDPRYIVLAPAASEQATPGGSRNAAKSNGKN